MRKVRIHFNLHKAGFVIRNRPNQVGDMQYLQTTCVRDARFVVSQATASRIRAKGQRAVCAWIEGIECNCGRQDSESVDVAYNPFTNDGFVVRDTNLILTSADHVTLRTINEKPITRAYRAR